MTSNIPQTIDLGIVVNVNWLKDHLQAGVIRVLDARPLDEYEDGHIPGAISIEMNAIREERDGIDGLIVGPESFATYVGQLGITRETPVVIYDDYHGMLAARIAWSFEYYGHTNVAILDGGWSAWEANGFSSENRSAVPSVATYEPVINDALIATHDWLHQQASNDKVALLDVRALVEYERGYILGAVLWGWENGTSDENFFLATDDIRSELAQRGITPDKEIVTYCQSGVRAAHTYYLLKKLGFERVRMYDGSWAEWSVLEAK